MGQTISPITVPVAMGSPTPTYAVVGSPPAGINFNTSTRVISGALTAVGSAVPLPYPGYQLSGE